MWFGKIYRTTSNHQSIINNQSQSVLICGLRPLTSCRATSQIFYSLVSNFRMLRLRFSHYYITFAVETIKTQPTMNYSTKKELAMAYCPDIDYTAALKKLNQWIRTNAELSARLAATGYIPTQRRFTPQQVRLLYHYLGEPF